MLGWDLLLLSLQVSNTTNTDPITARTGLLFTFFPQMEKESLGYIRCEMI